MKDWAYSVWRLTASGWALASSHATADEARAVLHETVLRGAVVDRQTLCTLDVRGSISAAQGHALEAAVLRWWNACDEADAVREATS